MVESRIFTPFCKKATLVTVPSLSPAVAVIVIVAGAGKDAPLAGLVMLAVGNWFAGPAPLGLQVLSDLSFVVACFSSCFAVLAVAVRFARIRSRVLDSELRARLPNNLQDGLDVELNAIFDIIRNQRNAAGHPSGATISQKDAHANLYVFPTFIAKVYALIGWLKANPV